MNAPRQVVYLVFCDLPYEDVEVDSVWASQTLAEARVEQLRRDPTWTQGYEFTVAAFPVRRTLVTNEP